MTLLESCNVIMIRFIHWFWWKFCAIALKLPENGVILVISSSGYENDWTMWWVYQEGLLFRAQEVAWCLSQLKRGRGWRIRLICWECCSVLYRQP
jgi:hypothetical protein